MPEKTFTIRRIRQDEGDAVAELWDRMCREIPDGGPLRPDERRNLQRMLEVAAFHHETFCLVAVTPAGAITGFAVGRVDPGDGLLPALVGEPQELYAPDAGVRHALATTVVARLESAGVQAVRARIPADEPDTQSFWTGLGFEADAAVMSRYPDRPRPGSGDEQR